MSRFECPTCGGREYILTAARRRPFALLWFLMRPIVRFDGVCGDCAQAVSVSREGVRYPRPGREAVVPVAERPPMRIVSPAPRPPAEPDWPGVTDDQATLPELP